MRNFMHLYGFICLVTHLMIVAVTVAYCANKMGFAEIPSEGITDIFYMASVIRVVSLLAFHFYGHWRGGPTRDYGHDHWYTR